MTRPPQFPRHFRLPWRSRQQILAEVDEELVFHIEMRTEELVTEGRSRDEAREQARGEFGDLNRVRTSLQRVDQRREKGRVRAEWLSALSGDLLRAFRVLRKTPAFTAVAILTLAIGIGAATSVLTVAEAFLLRPLPVRDQDQVVVLRGAMRDGSFDNFPLLLPDAREFARRVQSLERVEFFSSVGAYPVPIRDGSSVFRLRQALVTGGFFELLGTPPQLGRALGPDDDVLGGAPVAVLSHRAWQSYFGSDPDVVGRQLVLHETGVGHRIVGVMPLGLDYPAGTDFWSPVLPNSKPLGDEPAYAELSVLGRVRPGASPVDARDELTDYFGRPGAPVWHRDVHAVEQSLTRAILGDVRPAVLAFSAAAGLLLLITCINVANLLLIRGMARVGEFAVRSALGAQRPRIIRQLLTESALLAVAGAVIGIALAALALRGLVAFAPPGTPRLDEIRLSGTVVGGAVAITALTTLLFAVAPALLTSRLSPDDTLRSGTRLSGGRQVRLGMEIFVVGQVALALLVLSAAGLIAHSLMKLERVELALEPSRLLLAELAMPYEGFGDTQRQLTLLDDLLPRLETLPGVRSVTPVLTAPFDGGGGITAQIPAEEQTEEEAAHNPTVNLEPVTPSHFATLGIPILRGRGFSDQDREDTLPVAVVSESAARHYWPGEDPIGKRLKAPGDSGVTVVGVVPDTRYRDLRDPRPVVYLPLRQTSFPVAPTTLAIRMDAPLAAATIPALRSAVAEVNPAVAIASAATFDAYLDEQLVQPRLNALLLAAFAIAAIALAAVGIYGVMATTVRQRTREIGIRIALGATSIGIARLVLRRGMLLAMIGASFGLLGALAANRLLTSLLFDVSPTDPLTLSLVTAALMGIAALASLIPARASTRIEPTLAMRQD